MNLTLIERFSRVGALRGLIAEHAVTERLSPVRQICEMAYLKLFNGVGPFTYYRMGLFRRSIPWAEKRRFASSEWYTRIINRINPEEYRIVAWNKIVADGLLRQFNLPTPAFYGFVSPTNGQTCDGRELRTASDLESLVRRFSLREVCFKLVGGWSGRGFMRVTFEQRGDHTTARIAPNGSKITVDTLWRDHLDTVGEATASGRQRAYGYLCQEAVVQHPAIATLHRQSLNTIRVWMAQCSPGEWEMFGAVLRMGAGASCVDSGVAGGIGAPIDLATGRLQRAVRRGRRGRTFREYIRHPSSGATIEGLAVPMWGDVLPLCRRACSAFPYLRFMGLDVAITPDEVIIVEVEADPHASHQTHLGRGVRPLLSYLARAGRRMPLR